MNIIKKVPIPICGLALGFASLGNLLLANNYPTAIRNICGIISATLLVLVILKAIFYFEAVKKELQNVVPLTVFPTFFMAIMILTTYIVMYNAQIAKGIWLFAIITQILLVIFISYKYLINFKLENVFPTWFVTYVGFVVASVTAPAHSMQSFGQILFYIGLVFYIIVFVPIFNNIVIKKSLPNNLLPLVSIFLAPPNLLLAGYHSSFTEKNNVIIYSLLIVSIIMLVSLVSQMPRIFKVPFNPSFSGFAFAFTICGIAYTNTIGYIQSTTSFQYINVIQTINKVFVLAIALLLTYLLVMYGKLLTRKD